MGRVGVDWSKHNTQLYAITVSVHIALDGAYIRGMIKMTFDGTTRDSVNQYSRGRKVSCHAYTKTIAIEGVDRHKANIGDGINGQLRKVQESAR